MDTAGLECQIRVAPLRQYLRQIVPSDFMQLAAQPFFDVGNTFHSILSENTQYFAA
jgi:hypothetical protein